MTIIKKKQKLLSILGRLDDLKIIIDKPDKSLFDPNFHGIDELIYRGTKDISYIKKLINSIKTKRMKKLVGLSLEEIQKLNEMWDYWSSENTRK